MVKSLKVSHQMLAESVSQIQSASRSYSQAKPLLRDFYEKLLNHFSRQGGTFYESLFQFYQDDRPSGKMLEFLLHDLKDLKVRYLVFYELHAAEMTGGHPKTFSLDFAEFSGAILARIRMEEDYLLPLLEKISEI